MKYKRFLLILCCLSCIVLTAFAARPMRSLKIEVLGVSGDLKKNIELSLENDKNSLQRPLNKLRVRRFFHHAPRLIKDAIAPFGFFHPTISPYLVKTPNGWLTQFNVQQGVVNRVSQISVIVEGPGRNEKKFRDFLQNLPIKPNDPLHTEKYSKIKSDLYDIATQLGYFKATLKKNNIYVNVKTHQSKIIIIFDTGKRFRFGKTTFSKSKFHPRFLNRFLEYKVGEFYTADKLEKTQRELIDSNNFSQVLVKPVPSQAKNGEVPIQIILTPLNSRSYTMGAGYGTDTQVRGTLGITLRHIGDWGQRFKAVMRASQNNSSFIANYLMPGRNPAKDLFTISAGFTNIDLAADSSGKNLSFGGSYSRKSGHWQNAFSLTYLNERYSIKGLPFTRTQMVYPMLSTQYLITDHPMNPTAGLNFSAQISGASKNILSEATFTQITTQIKALYTIKKTHTRLIFRNNLGFTNIKNLNQLPLSLQLQAGGSKSVRGFSYNVLGPGRNLIIGSAEIQQRVYKQWYLAVFADAAVIGNKDVFNKIYAGVGPGIVWLTPVGAIELSIANAVSEPHTPWMFQFTMGSVLT